MTRQLMYPILYYDAERRYYLALRKTGPKTEEEPAQPPLPEGHTYHVVGDLNQLAETIFVLEAGVEISIVDVIKLSIICDLQKRFRDSLIKMKDFPMDSSRLLFLRRQLGRHGEKSLLFVYYRPHDPALFLLSLLLPEEPTLRQAQKYLHASSQPEDTTSTTRPFWAHLTRGRTAKPHGEVLPTVKTEMLFDSELLRYPPFTVGLWEVHREIWKQQMENGGAAPNAGVSKP